MSFITNIKTGWETPELSTAWSPSSAPALSRTRAAEHRARRRQASMRRARGQNAILDRGLATILATVAIIGALASYFLFSGNNNAQAEQSQIASIAAEVDNLYGSQSSYAGLTTAVIAGSGALPPAWVTPAAGAAGATITSVYRSAITLAPVNNVLTGLVDGAWTLTLAGVPQAACVTLSTTNVGSGEFGVSINGAGAPAGVVAAGANPLPTPAAATTACNKNANTLAFYLT